jgi:hypothetical protein
MTKKMAALVVFAMVASLSAAGCVINPSSHSASRFTPNKWVGIDISVANDLLTPDMLAYMEANHWGLWIEGLNFWSGASDYSGNNNVSPALAAYEAQCDPLFTNIQNNYHIPIMLNLNEISAHWSWGDTQANTDAHSPAWYEANFGPIFSYTETWANGTRGDCFTTYWYEAGWPSFAQWLRNRTTLQINWALPAWQDYLNSTPGHDVCTNPAGFSWITGVGNQMTIAQRIALVDEVDLEIWYTSDVPVLVNALSYLNTSFPTKPVGIDSMDQGGYNINLWGSAYGLNDHPTTYAAGRAAYQLYIGQLKTARGRPFDTLMAEWSGNSDGTVQGGSEFQIVTDQLNFMLNCGWIT